MAAENNILGLRAQIAENMGAMGMSSTAHIVTVMAADGDWQALIVDNMQIIERTDKWVKSKEAALEDLLKCTSHLLYMELQVHFF